MSEKLVWVLGLNLPSSPLGIHEPIGVTDDEAEAKEWVDRKTVEGEDAMTWTFHLNEVP